MPKLKLRANKIKADRDDQEDCPECGSLLEVDHETGKEFCPDCDGGVKSQSKKANVKLEDMGDEEDIFHTEGLPATGHDSAIDDDQQPYRSAALMERVAETISGTGDKPTARRLKTLASQTRQLMSGAGIHEPKANNPDLYSTSSLNFPGEGISNLGDNGKTIDEDQKGQKLEFYGAYPPTRDEAGPRRRSSIKRAGRESWVVYFANGTTTKVDASSELEAKRKAERQAVLDGETGDGAKATEAEPEPFPKKSSKSAATQQQFLHEAGRATSMGLERYLKRYKTIKTPEKAAAMQEFLKGVRPYHKELDDQIGHAIMQLNGTVAKGGPTSGKKTANPCPLPEYKAKMVHLLKNLNEDTYEANEPNFHQHFEEMKDTVGDGVTSCSDNMVSSSRKASTSSSPWRSIKAALVKTATNGGSWGSGKWSVGTEDYGKVMDLKVDTHQQDGSPLVAGTVTFSLVKENPTDRSATVEIADPILNHETKQLKIPERMAKQFATEWSKNAEMVAKDILDT